MFDVASYRHLPDEYLHGRPVSWLFAQFWSVQRAQWRQWTGMVTATEIALMRGLSAAFSGKDKAKLKPLPTWAEVSGEKKGKQAARASFAERVERANLRQQDEQKDGYGDDG